jgi:hypothetical protein
VYECLNILHGKESGEASGFGAFVCIFILHHPPRYKMTNTLLEDSTILEMGGEYKLTQIHRHTHTGKLSYIRDHNIPRQSQGNTST